ncbi:hypothetical protein ACFLWI_08110 [Chloroflexota bacterium]
MIRNVIKCPDGMVMVFDSRGELIPEYQGQYEEVKGKILRAAPPNAVFGYFPNREKELEKVSREEW